MDTKPALTRWQVPLDDFSWHMAKDVGSDAPLRRLLAPFYETTRTCSPPVVPPYGVQIRRVSWLLAITGAAVACEKP